MFDNTQVAFEDKTDKDLNRAYFLFKTISNPFISKTLTGYNNIKDSSMRNSRN